MKTCCRRSRAPGAPSRSGRNNRRRMGNPQLDDPVFAGHVCCSGTWRSRLRCCKDMVFVRFSPETSVTPTGYMEALEALFHEGDTHGDWVSQDLLVKSVARLRCRSQTVLVRACPRDAVRKKTIMTSHSEIWEHLGARVADKVRGRTDHGAAVARGLVSMCRCTSFRSPPFSGYSIALQTLGEHHVREREM